MQGEKEESNSTRVILLCFIYATRETSLMDGGGVVSSIKTVKVVYSVAMYRVGLVGYNIKRVGLMLSHSFPSRKIQRIRY
jgi:hypothetical protein